ncbi:lipopolysaccharide assembly protein LapB [Moritella sp. JT01]|uniref:tetratricopeptide repeat protein n=1 Tax=Moritella sp. JT01 TaxID=756698 RepID=UPI0018DB2ECE|nr:tetratricopeptide repeat protein [Moritella sp. JT01]
MTSHDDAKLIAFYKQNLKRQPDYMLKLINIYLNQDDTASAKIYVEMLSSDEKDTPAALFVIARMYYHDGELNSALDKVKKLQLIRNKDSKVELLAGKIYAGLRQFVLAKQSFQDALRLGHEDKVIKNNLALLHMMQGQYEAAIKILRPLYKADPEDQTVESNLLIAVINNGNIDLARSILASRYSGDVAEQNLELLMAAKTKKRNEPIAMVEEWPATALYKQSITENTKLITDDSIEMASLMSRDFTPVNSDETVFRVQIFASNEQLSEIQLARFKKYQTDIYFYNFGFWKRYCIGKFTTLKEARLFKEHLNAKGAFVVEYPNKDYKIVYEYAA